MIYPDEFVERRQTSPLSWRYEALFSRFRSHAWRIDGVYPEETYVCALCGAKLEFPGTLNFSFMGETECAQAC